MVSGSDAQPAGSQLVQHYACNVLAKRGYATVESLEGQFA